MAPTYTGYSTLQRDELDALFKDAPGADAGLIQSVGAAGG